MWSWDLKKAVYFLITLSFVVGITIGSSTNVIAQQASIPSWIKNTAKWWGEGQVSDSEFIKALQWLIDQKILVVSQSSTSQSSSLPSSPPATETYTPTGVTANVVSPTQIDLSWTPPSNTYGQQIIGYKIEEKLSSGIYNTVVDNTGQKTSYSIENLSTGQTYTFIVVALFTGGVDSNPSAEISVTPAEIQDTATILSITKRYDGQNATDKIKQIFSASDALSVNDKVERLNREASQSQFALGVGGTGSWLGAISDGSSLISINGNEPSIIPFQCEHVISQIYSVSISKTSSGNDQLFITIFKNGILIDGGKTTSPFGMVALHGDCDSPDIVNNLKKLSSQ